LHVLFRSIHFYLGIFFEATAIKDTQSHHVVVEKLYKKDILLHAKSSKYGVLFNCYANRTRAIYFVYADC